MSLKFKILLPFIFIVPMLQCGDSFDEKYDKAVLSAMTEDITALIGQPQCGGVNDCRYIAFGAKPCGGPWEYLIYSISVTDSAELAEKVDFYNGYEDMMNHKYGYVSDCSVPDPPELGCVDGVCVDISAHLDQ